ncbi:MAG TPA: hypothetical protein V6D29_06180 [Leptolyngbyaceae cyanobacterium]
MKEPVLVVAGMGAAVWFGTSPAQATEALSFDLPSGEVASTAAHAKETQIEEVAAVLPPSMFTAMSENPLDFQPPSSPDSLLEGAGAIAPIPEPPDISSLPAPNVSPPVADATATLPPPPELAPVALVPVEIPKAEPSKPLIALFAGGSDSLVARAVGSAEGTRTPEGLRTAAYYGHVDPGNGAWNLGSFSYQHGAHSPQEADERQLQRLQTQALKLRQLATSRDLDLSLEEELNGIDLANQAPLAALDRGYIDWLAQAQKLGMTGSEAILWARTRAFLDPDSGRWNAPGLGNTVADITQDQERRMTAIAKAIAAHPKVGQIATAPQPETLAEIPVTADAIAEAIINLDLDLPDSLNPVTKY